MNQDEAEFDSEVTALGRYVEGASKGDEAKLKVRAWTLKLRLHPLVLRKGPKA